MTLSLEGLRAFVEDGNVRAVLRCVRHSELPKAYRQTDDAYRVLFGGELVADLLRHPRIAKMSPWGWTSAAGAYQAMAEVPGKVKTDTWGDFCRDMGSNPDEMPFDAEHQDLFAVWCLKRRGALQDAVHGLFDKVVEKCSWEWASWPPGRYGQPTTTLETLRNVYMEHGGRFAVDDLIQPPAPIEDRDLSNLPPVQPPESKMPLPLLAILSVVGPLISELIPQVARAFDRKEDTPGKVEAATKIVDTIVKATNSVNIQDAVEKMQSDPAVLQVAKTAVVTEPSIQALLEIGGGIEAAREANLEMQNAPKSFMFNPAWWISIILLLFPIMLLADVFWVHPDAYNAELRTQIVTSILGVILVISGYWLGTSAGSARKTDIIAQQGK
jgi:muramidase (phage lysozyme)